MQHQELPAQDLCNSCDPSVFHFETTDDLKPDLVGIIGQERGVDAIHFGLHIKSDGFNLYVAGRPGTGRSTSIMNAVKAVAAAEPAPDDICYLHNFSKEDEPKAIKLPAGQGCRFHDDMDDLVKDLENEIQKAFTSEEYESHKKEIVDRFEARRDQINAELQQFAAARNSVLKQTFTEIMVLPMHKGHPMTEEEFEKLPDDRKEQIKSERQEIDAKIFDFSRQTRDLQKKLKDELEEFDRRAGLYSVGHLVDEIKKKYQAYPVVAQHLDDVLNDILQNLEAFKRDEKSEAVPFRPSGPTKADILGRYRVNLLVDHCDTQGAPVVVEHNPTYYNINGYAEYRAQFGVLSTDFSMVKPGAAHKAAGGYLIIHASEVLLDMLAWDSLKRIINHKKVKMENIAERFGFVPTTGLKPQPVAVELKVILIGEPLLYHLLYAYDDDFRKLFKVKADFDTVLDRTHDKVNSYAAFVAGEAKQKNLLPFSKAAVARLIDYSSKKAENKEKLTAELLEVSDIMREADFWARQEEARVVDAGHIRKATRQRIVRSSMIEDKIEELIEEGTIIVDIANGQVGQINGISVLDVGDYAFGKPSRITAKAFLGREGIINIEREVKLSGRIHSKGVLILGGFLGDRYAREIPLALSATICFEQLYEEVEGDSASSAELYALLSSLSQMPLRQELAVTGSVDQRGLIQPVGGINQKIEGFFRLCKAKGLTGTQGVMIPATNVRHLMLDEDVVSAVEQGQFHIYPVDTIDKGIEILTGLQAGERGPDGHFPKESINGKVEARLLAFAQTARIFEAGAKQEFEPEEIGAPAGVSTADASHRQASGR